MKNYYGTHLAIRITEARMKAERLRLRLAEAEADLKLLERQQQCSFMKKTGRRCQHYQQAKYCANHAGMVK